MLKFILSWLHSLKPKSFISEKKIIHFWHGLLKVCVPQAAQELKSCLGFHRGERLRLWNGSSGFWAGPAPLGTGKEQTWWTKTVALLSECCVDVHYWLLQLLLTKPAPNLSIQMLPERRRLGVGTIWAALLTVEITWKFSVLHSGILPLYIFQKSRVVK